MGHERRTENIGVDIARKRKNGISNNLDARDDKNDVGQKHLRQ